MQNLTWKWLNLSPICSWTQLWFAMPKDPQLDEPGGDFFVVWNLALTRAAMLNTHIKLPTQQSVHLNFAGCKFPGALGLSKTILSRKGYCSKQAPQFSSCVYLLSSIDLHGWKMGKKYKVRYASNKSNVNSPGLRSGTKAKNEKLNVLNETKFNLLFQWN